MNPYKRTCGTKCCWHNDAGVCTDARAACGDRTPPRQYKAFGWDVTVRMHDGSTKVFHYRGCTEGAARRKAMLKPLTQTIVSVEPLTEQQWISAYGIGRV